MAADFQIIDMTQALSPNMAFWDGVGDFGLELETDYKDCTAPNLFRTQKINSGAGVGTHMDAPAHCFEGGRTIDLLTMDELIADCFVVDVTSRADENYLIMPSDIEEFEKAHGQIPQSSLVIFYTGWSKFWSEPAKYHNNHKFPGLHSSAAEILVKRGVAGVGIDTLSCDTGANGFPAHRIILGADKYLVENIANADKLPPKGAKVFVMPTKIKGATEAPVRLVALI